MKKLLITTIFIVFTTIASAQQNNRTNKDTLQPRPIESQQVQQPISVDEAQAKSKAEFQAVKRAKDKGSTQKVTTAERAVSDSVKKPKEVKPQISHDKPSY